MKEDRSTAGAILETARALVTKDRHDTHGDAENSFAMIADLWSAYLAGVDPIKLRPLDVAHMMTLLKIARSVYGDGTNADHYVDAAGYQGLAGMLATAKVQTPASELPKPSEPMVPRHPGDIGETPASGGTAVALGKPAGASV